MTEGTLIDVPAEVPFPRTKQFMRQFGGLWFLKPDGTRWKDLPVSSNPFSRDRGTYVPLLKMAAEASRTPIIANTIGDKVAQAGC